MPNDDFSYVLFICQHSLKQKTGTVNMLFSLEFKRICFKFICCIQYNIYEETINDHLLPWKQHNNHYYLHMYLLQLLYKDLSLSRFLPHLGWTCECFRPKHNIVQHMTNRHKNNRICQINFIFFKYSFLGVF